jgi:hypothetical protein
MGITTMVRDIIAGTIATTVGKEEPGAIRAFSLLGSLHLKPKYPQTKMQAAVVSLWVNQAKLND